MVDSAFGKLQEKNQIRLKQDSAPYTATLSLLHELHFGFFTRMYQHTES